MPLDDQLKQRLIGATIIVALIVLFVPLLFDPAPDPSAEAFDSAAEHSLPPASEAVAPVAGGSEPSVEGDGYKIIPLTDSTGSEPVSAIPKADESAAASSPEHPSEYLEEEGAGVVEVPTPDSPLGRGVRSVAPLPAASEKSGAKKKSAVAAPSTELSRSASTKSPDEDGAAKSQTSAAVKAGTPHAKTPVDVAKKPTVTRAPPSSAALSQARSATKPAINAASARREEKKAAAKASETTKSSPPAKATSPALPPKKKPEVAGKAATTVAEASTGEAAASGAAAIQPAKAPTQAKSMVARKPKGEDAPTRWVVQTSSFTSEASAKALAEKLRKNKFDAFVETVPGAGGVNYRVSVGPEPDKGRAEQARKRLESSVGMSGTVSGRK
jgi:DedD protein